MLLHQALTTRRTIYFFEPKPVPREALERALEAARFAPNHKLTEPWRFVVMGPKTQSAIADIMERTASGNAPPEPDARVKALAAARAKIADVPLIVAAAYVRSPADAFRDREDYAATCCAIQNFMLSLWGDGIGCQWGTGAITRHAETYAALGINPVEQELIAFLKCGYPKLVPETKRRPLADVVSYQP